MSEMVAGCISRVGKLTRGTKMHPKPNRKEIDEETINRNNVINENTQLNSNRREVDKYHCFSCSEPILMVVSKKLIQKINCLCVEKTTINE